ncbi:NUDIX hydrolase [Kitasatospora sp. NPDC001159]
MTEPRPAAVRLLEPARLRLVETPPPPLPPADRAAMDHAWEKAASANPGLFDRPVVACTGLAADGPDTLVLHWARIRYRRFALRLVPGATARVSCLFAAVVQPADDGRILVGRMADPTAHPGRWCLPGGSVEPPPDGEPLDPCALRRRAAAELAEETGVLARPEELAMWLLVQGEHGNLGVLHLAPHRPARELYERPAELSAAHQTRGAVAEFDRIALVGTAAEAAALPGPRVDYLGPVLCRLAEGKDPRDRS